MVRLPAESPPGGNNHANSDSSQISEWSGDHHSPGTRKRKITKSMKTPPVPNPIKSLALANEAIGDGVTRHEALGGIGGI